MIYLLCLTSFETQTEIKLLNFYIGRFGVADLTVI